MNPCRWIKFVYISLTFWFEWTRNLCGRRWNGHQDKNKRLLLRQHNPLPFRTCNPSLTLPAQRDIRRRRVEANIVNHHKQTLRIHIHRIPTVDDGRKGRRQMLKCLKINTESKRRRLSLSSPSRSADARMRCWEENSYARKVRILCTVYMQSTGFLPL